MELILKIFAEVNYDEETKIQVMACFRRVEDTTKKQIQGLPKLSFDLYNLYSGLNFCFDIAREFIKSDSQGEK